MSNIGIGGLKTYRTHAYTWANRPISKSDSPFTSSAAVRGASMRRTRRTGKRSQKQLPVKFGGASNTSSRRSQILSILFLTVWASPIGQTSQTMQLPSAFLKKIALLAFGGPGSTLTLSADMPNQAFGRTLESVVALCGQPTGCAGQGERYVLQIQSLRASLSIITK